MLFLGHSGTVSTFIAVGKGRIIASSNWDAMWKLGSSCLIHEKVNEIYSSIQSYLFNDDTDDLFQRFGAEQQNMSILAKSNKKIAPAVARHPEWLLHGGQGLCGIYYLAYNVFKFSGHRRIHYGRPHVEHSIKCGCCVSSREAIEKRVELKPKPVVCGNCKIQTYEIALETAVEKIVDSEKLSGYDKVGDTNEEPQDKCTMRTAIFDATAALYAAAITGAVKDITSKNDVERHSKIVTGFSVGEKAVITDYLSKELAEFEIQVFLKSGPQRATLHLYRKCCKVFVQKKKLFSEPYSPELQIRIRKGSQFVLKLSNGSSYTCDTEGDFILRDKIVVTAKAFLMKNFFLAKQLPTWTKPPTGWLKLNTYGDGGGGIGGLIRDDSGTWITGFWGQVPKTSQHQLQLEALRRGLRIAQEIRGTRRIIAEIQSFIVANRLQDARSLPLEHPCARLTFECKQILKELGESNCKLVYIDRKGDFAARLLAILGLQLVNMDVKRSDVPLDILRLVLLEESTGLPSYMLQVD